MISLNNWNNSKDYYLLEDGQGGTFGGGRIFEGLQEIKDQCAEYADMDGYDDPTLSSWTISNCLENWTFTLWKYDGTKFVECDKEYEMDFISNDSRKLRVKHG